MTKEAQIKAEPDDTKQPLRFWQTVAFRTGVLVNLIVIAVLGIAGFVDDQRDRRGLLRQETERLQEEAKVLAVAQAQLRDDAAFQRFLDDFCRQMSAAASPGHHIAFLDASGKTVLRAHQHANADLETKMASGLQEEKRVFTHAGQDYLVVGTAGATGATIAIAQSLEPLERMLYSERRSRAFSLATLLVLVSGLTGMGLYAWVRRPLRALVNHVHAVEAGAFDVRAKPSGSAEVRYLAAGLNEMTRSLEQAEQVRQQGMRRARKIQEGLLPPRHQRANGLLITAAFLPTESVGGDLYDVIPLADGSTLIALMDVAGHGVPAALYTALLRTVLRYEATGAVHLAAIMTRMNHEVRQLSGSQDFVTCIIAHLNSDDGVLGYTRAGHEPAIVVGPDGNVEELAHEGIVLGIEATPSFKVSQVPFGSEDRMFLFTDGLHEVVDGKGRMLGRAELIEMIVGERLKPLPEQIEAVVDRVRSFQGGGGFLDDVTLVGVARAS